MPGNFFAWPSNSPPRPNDRTTQIPQHADLGGAAKLINLPASYHAQAGNLSFVDGHSEAHKWRDPRTTVPMASTQLSEIISSPNNSDVLWLQLHYTFPVVGN